MEKTFDSNRKFHRRKVFMRILTRMIRAGARGPEHAVAWLHHNPLWPHMRAISSCVSERPLLKSADLWYSRNSAFFLEKVFTMAANQVLSSHKRSLLGQTLPQRTGVRAVSCRGSGLAVRAQQEQVSSAHVEQRSTADTLNSGACAMGQAYRWLSRDSCCY